VRTVCREALCVAENVIHPRLPVVGVEALSRCIGDGHSPADVDDTEAESSLFGRRFDLSRNDDHSDVEPSHDEVARIEVHSSVPVTESHHVSAASSAMMLPSTDSRLTDKRTYASADYVSCSPSRETTTEVVDASATRNADDQNDITSLASVPELEKSDSVSFVSAASSFAVSPTRLSTSTMTLLNTVPEDGAAEESFETLTAPETSAAAECSEPEVVTDKQQESESEQSLRKRKYSTTSSRDDADDSESEGGEIEVWSCSSFVAVVNLV